jgi:putative ABC transport system substrate-binding protein
MRRRDFIALIPGAAIAWPMPLHAQQSAKYSRVAYLALAGDEDAAVVKRRLDELGYHEGKNLIFDFRTAEGRLGARPDRHGGVAFVAP